MTKQLRTNLVSKFKCLADDCEDTCCQHWSMQLDGATFAKYQDEKPELLAVAQIDSDGGCIMKKDPQTGYCVKFSDGKCGIQVEYGEDFLGDACALYPRITRKIGDIVVQTATMSCPEIARLALYGEDPFSFAKGAINRIPHEIKNVLPDEMTPQDALAIHEAFIAATEDENASAEHILARINSVANSLQNIAKKDWLGATPVYLRLADGRLPAPETNINDPFNLLHALCGLVVASRKSTPPRLAQTISDIETALHAKLDWQNVLIQTSDDSVQAYNNLQKPQKSDSPILKKWLAAQISAAFFPFAGLGETLPEKITIIGVRFFILRLAIMSAPDKKDIIRIVQSLSRFLDHLGSPAFFLQICAETGWDKEARMRGLLT